MKVEWVVRPPSNKVAAMPDDVEISLCLVATYARMRFTGKVSPVLPGALGEKPSRPICSALGGKVQVFGTVIATVPKTALRSALG